MKDPIQAALRAHQGAALIPFLTAGYPSRDATPALLESLDQAGAAVIELGIPFSDSLADGPTVQSSYHQAIADGMTLPRALDALAEVAPRLRAPVVLMGSINPILACGVARFLARAKAAGAAGVLVPDLPPEEAAEFRRAARREGLAALPLAAPNTPYERYRLLARRAGGFLYQISRTGTTGVREGSLPADLRPRVEWARRVTGLPVALGFGISTPHQVRQAWQLADAAVVGSALIRALAPERRIEACAARAREFVAGLLPAERRRR